MMKIGYSPDDLIAQNPRWSFTDFEFRAQQIGLELQQRDIQSIAVWLEDGAKLACLLLGAWQVGVRVLFPPNLTEESQQWIAENAQFVITDKPLEIENALSFDELGCHIALSEFPQNQPLFDLHNQTEIWLKTSGSTGGAKTIVKTAEQMWFGGKVLADSLPFSAENMNVVSTVSIQHIYGLTVHIMMSLVKGWQIGRKQLFDPESIIFNVRECENAILVSSPTMLSGIDWQTMRLPDTLIGAISSGGVLPDDLAEQIRAQFPVFEIYGSTETGPIAVRQDCGLWQQLPESRLGTNDAGELWIEGAWLGKREQTADVVEFQNKGFQLLGRSDRIVKIGDKRVGLVSVEQQLNKHPWVDDCYIAPHPEKTRLAAWVGLSAQGIDYLRDNGRKALVEQLKASLKNTQDDAAIPRFWRFCETLPRNSQSKINKLEFNRTFTEQCKDPIWNTANQSAHQLNITGKVPLDLVYLKDHFAQFPLVPGAVELQWIFEQMAVLIGKPIECPQIDKLKFQKFLRPADSFSLNLKWDEIKGKVAFQLTTQGEPCCSGIALIA